MCDFRPLSGFYRREALRVALAWGPISSLQLRFALVCIQSPWWLQIRFLYLHPKPNYYVLIKSHIIDKTFSNIWLLRSKISAEITQLFISGYQLSADSKKMSIFKFAYYDMIDKTKTHSSHDERKPYNFKLQV